MCHLGISPNTFFFSKWHRKVKRPILVLSLIVLYYWFCQPWITRNHFHDRQFYSTWLISNAKSRVTFILGGEKAWGRNFFLTVTVIFPQSWTILYHILTVAYTWQVHGLWFMFTWCITSLLQIYQLHIHAAKKDWLLETWEATLT